MVLRLYIFAIGALCIVNVSAKTVENPWSKIHGDTLSRVKRVISGEEVMEGEWPWLVHIEGDVSYDRSDSSWFCFWCDKDIVRKSVNCGGTIIAGQYVLTAAHCVDDEDDRLREELHKPKALHVTYGEIEVDCGVIDWIKHIWGRITGSPEDRCHIHSQEVYIHDNYKRGKDNYWDYDFAIIKVEVDMLGTDKAKKIDLPLAGFSGWPATGEIGYVHGWGCTEEGGSMEDVAQEAELPILSDSECRSTFGSGYDTSTHICAGGNGASVCSGDSGGPLVAKYGDNYYLAGVISFYVPTDSVNHPSGFARTTAALSWILDTAEIDTL